MQRYYHIYQRLFYMSYMRLIMYRANFISSLTSTVMWGVFIFISMFLVTTQAPNAYGWQRLELMLLISAYSTLIGLFHMLFSKNFELLSRIILVGDLDTYLIKPVDSQFLVTTNNVSILSSFRIWLGLGSAIYFFNLGKMWPTFTQLLFCVVFLLSGLFIIYSIWLIVCTSLVWFPRASNLVQLMYSVTGFARFPKQMYSSLGSIGFLLFFPLVLVLNPAVRSIISNPSLPDILLSVIVATSFFTLSRWFWLFALKHYTSASS